MRSALRSELTEVTQRNSARSFAQQREELGKEFGTKKAKKIIASKTENAITAGGAKDVEAAVLDSVNAAADNLVSREHHDSSVLAAKPIPRPNLEAEVVKDVYPLGVLAPQGDLRNMNVKDWQDAVTADQEVRLTSRFVANRLRAVVAGGDVQKLKALKYLLLLLSFNDALVQMKGGKKLPQREQFKTKMADWQDSLVDNVRRRFAEARYVLTRRTIIFGHLTLALQVISISGMSTTSRPTSPLCPFTSTIGGQISTTSGRICDLI